ncbi:hypothetical protein CDD82_116 [Ophiocordyceps australis]|uniref:Ran-specific GTPase-activating protein 30 n=1 Tax=Ophiocordyceps australis TaxID=1399860 RepID=A0A2C5YUD6_9HYPO|nr:hypothetical protein CDD82_116 [Ophiocordyceps australis]
MRFAIRSGITYTSTYALGQFSRLLKSVDDRNLYSELRQLQNLLDSKIKIISPAIDLIEFKSGRGNVFLESAVPLTKSLHRQIISLGDRIEAIAALKEGAQKVSSKDDLQVENLRQIIVKIKELLERIDREIPLLQLAITASGETLSTSLPSNISPSRLLQASTLLTVGDTQYAQDPTRNVQIGPAFSLSLYMLFVGHASPDPGIPSATDDKKPVYGVGVNERKPLWQEVIHKARVRLCRSARKMGPNGRKSDSLVHGSPVANESFEYAYHLEVIEDLDDGRVHEDARNAEPYDDILMAGFRETIPISQLSKIFYTDTGRMLNIGTANEVEHNPILLLKRDPKAAASPKTRPWLRASMGEGSSDAEADLVSQTCSTDGDEKDIEHGDFCEDEQAEIDRQLGEESAVDNHEAQEMAERDCPPPGLPKQFDAEWLAFEVYDGDVDDGSSSSEADCDSDDDEGVGRQAIKDSTARGKSPRQRCSLDSRLAVQIRSLSLQPPASPGQQHHDQGDNLSDSGALDFVARSPFRTITTSLSLIEMLVRLAGLQEFQQTSHLAIPDHVLTFFLEETSTTGLSGEARRNMRDEATRRVGFDPYTE